MRRFITVLAISAFLLSAGYVSAADKAPAKDSAAASTSDSAPAKGKSHKHHHGKKGGKKQKEEAAPATK